MEELKQDLIKRKFPILLIQDRINKAIEKNQCDLRQVKNKTRDKKKIETKNIYLMYQPLIQIIRNYSALSNRINIS